jgi:DNA replication licensing factor MCM5
MDRQSVTTTRIYPRDAGDGLLGYQIQLEKFIMDFRLENNFIYRYGSLRNQGRLESRR